MYIQKKKSLVGVGVRLGSVHSPASSPAARVLPPVQLPLWLESAPSSCGDHGPGTGPSGVVTGAFGERTVEEGAGLMPWGEKQQKTSPQSVSTVC